MNLLHQLVTLQAIDRQLQELEQQKGNLPLRVDEMKQSLAGLNDRMTARRARATEVTMALHAVRLDEADRKSKLEKRQEELYRVQTNREYDALSAEIDRLKGELDADELKELELGEEEERLKKELEQDEKERERLGRELETDSARLEEMIRQTEADVSDLLAQRESLIPQVDSRHLLVYERVREAREGIAVVPVEDDACGGCFTRLTPQMVVVIRSGENVVNCTHCRRYLYWPASE